MSDKKTKTGVFEGRSYQLDNHGYLDPPDQWDETFARGMALNAGILNGLSDRHWQVIKYLRRRFVDEQFVPLVVNCCMDNDLRLGHLRALFPTGYHRGACKIAGLNYDFMSRNNLWLTYENYTTLRTDYRMTETGFLDDFEHWNERFAHLVMHESDSPSRLTDKHKEVIRFLRDHYSEFGSLPSIFETCKRSGIDLEGLATLFPGGYRRGACRAAGLPFFG